MKILKNNGFTLIEMIVAFAVLGVAVFGIGGFFVSAARSYSSVSDETSLQYEAQLALNQVESMLIDSTLGVSYNFVSTTASAANGGYQFVEKDSEATGTVASKVLYAYNAGSAANSLDIMMLKWDAEKKSIYYKVEPVSNPGPAINTIDVSSTLTGWDLLAEDVTTFSVDLSEYAKTKKVEIELGFENRSKDYATSGTVVLRNDVLINEMNVGKIYERITKSKPSIITGIELTSNMNITVPGGTVQLFTNVLGENYPETKIEQYQWIVAKNSACTDVIYDSLVNYSESNPRPSTYVDTSNKVLRVSADTTGEGSEFNETLWVKVIAITNELDESNNPIKHESTALSIGVKLINNIVVTVAADTTQTYNSNLVNKTFDEATWLKQKEQSPIIPTMILVPRNVVQLTAQVTSSDSIRPEDKVIIWSIHGIEEGVRAEIDSTGLLNIHQYSKEGRFIVRATLKMDIGVYVEYNVKVVNEDSAGNAKLEVVPKESTLNRGGNVNCSLLLNDIEVDNSDYDWSVSILSSSGQEITGNPVTVNKQGEVYANYALSYDYSYDVYVSATLKTNPTITATTRITVPKVSLTISPLIKFSDMGDTVSGITCTAIGLKEYDIQWKMSKDSNPNYFFTAWGNFNITGGKNSKGERTATIVMGIKGDDPQTNCTVKATLKNNSNYQATMRILSANVSMSITGPVAISRPFADNEYSEIDLNVAVQNAANTNISVTNDTVKWEILDAKVDNKSVTSVLDKNTISLEKGKLRVYKTFAPEHENKSVVLTIKASDTTYGLEATHTVTVNPVSFDISPAMILIPDGSSEMTIQFSPMIAGWSISGNNPGRYYEGQYYGGDGISIDSATGVLTLPANNRRQSDNKKLTIKLEQYNKSTNVQFGFENVSSVSGWTVKEITNNGYGNDKYIKYSIRKSDYKVLNANGVPCPIYYVGYQQKKYSYNGYGNIVFYAFVSNSNQNLTSGTWYKASGTGNMREWKESSSAPNKWNSSYFNSYSY